MSEEQKNDSQNGAQPQNSAKKIVKKKVVSSFSNSAGNAYGYGNAYGGGYGYGYGYGGYRYDGGSYGSYGKSYGTYGSSYGQNYGAAPQVNEVPNRTFADYLQILREKIWFIAITFLVILAGTLLYTFRVTPVYTSRATIRILRTVDKPVDADRSRRDDIRDIQDFNTQIKLLESMEVVSFVKKQLKPEEAQRLMAPYHDMFTFGAKITEEGILVRNRSIAPNRMSFVVNIDFTHPDKDIAARIANLYAKEFITYSQQTNSSDMLMMIEALRDKVNFQDTKVRELESKLVNYRKENKAESLDQRVDMLAKELSDITTSATIAKQNYEAAQTEWRIIQECEREKGNLWELPRIRANALVSQILQQRSMLQIDMAQYEKRYKPKHPKMIELTRRLEQINNELDAAVKSTVQEVSANYEMVQKNYETLQRALAEKNAERNELSDKAVAYKVIEREKNAAEMLLQEMQLQMNKRLAEVNLIPASAKIVDTAFPTSEPSSPNYLLNIILGVLGGILGGIVMAFAVAFLDDKTKSAHDVESIIGLPLLGAIPRIKRLNSSEKAQISASNADRGAAEAFKAVLSAIKLSPSGKTAKVILSTSTTPSEGKSFVLSNLAFTAAMNGEKTLIIDADLRLPAIAKILDLKTSSGLISYIEGKNSLKESIVSEYFPNLDVMPCERRASNPTQILNSEEFMRMLQELRASYDKIFIDTPPIGAVSDAISVLPYVDGMVYVIKFNAIKRKVIKNYVKRLVESNVQILGAIMNMVGSSSSGMYNSSYYNKSYHSYYISEEPPSADLEEDQEEAAAPDPEGGAQG
ncbi:MAG: polysaccharide biosynthesis tyrosine autokinase [Opitutales bacterium]|nr:polysaccharide biosynthesis tyrosine autokinase [Opitutales bacterium]